MRRTLNLFARAGAEKEEEEVEDEEDEEEQQQRVLGVLPERDVVVAVGEEAGKEDEAPDEEGEK
eukprot:evm.model.NODE_44091_length_5621_cov_7.827789.1